MRTSAVNVSNLDRLPRVVRISDCCDSNTHYVLTCDEGKVKNVEKREALIDHSEIHGWGAQVSSVRPPAIWLPVGEAI
jgi:hypothetical protein